MIGNIIAAGASLAGGLLNRASAKDAAAREEFRYAQQAAQQEEFAKKGIQWRVKDALAAGIHPIYALGSSGATYTPTSTNFTADTSLGTAMASAGQDIGRAVNATQTKPDQVSAYTMAAQKLALEKGGLENELLRTEIASKTGRLVSPAQPAMASVGNPFLIPGQADSSILPEAFKSKPIDRAPTAPSHPHQEPGAVPDVGYARTATGWAPVPSRDVKERIEDNLIQEVMWAIRNNILPSMGWYDRPNIPTPPDKKIIYNPLRQEYQHWQKPSWQLNRSGYSGGW